MNCCFIAHGDAARGMGHVMRCLALAEALSLMGVNVFFISEGKDAQKIIKSKGFQAIPLNVRTSESRKNAFWYGDKKELIQEIKCVEKILSIRNDRMDLTIIDTYNASNQYFGMVKTHSDLVCYVDDLNAFHYDVDIILNGTFGAYALDYRWFHKTLLKGLDYLLLRKEFWNIPEKAVNRNVKDILITTGGADPDNMSDKILDAIYDDSQEINIHLIIGRGFHHISFLQDKWGEKKNIKFYLFPNEVAPIMLNCDLAVSAGGTTLYELGICQTPVMAFVYAKNQEKHISELCRQNLIEHIGFASNWNKEAFVKKYKNLFANYEKREKMAKSFRKIVTGNGTLNVAERLIAEMNTT